MICFFYYFVTQVIESDLDCNILKLQESFQKSFNSKWAKHNCDVPGCPDTLTFDGGLKPHRKFVVPR